MNEGLLTDREIASLVFLGVLALVVLVAASRKPGALHSLVKGVRGLLRWRVVVLILIHLGCLSVAVWAASRLGIWEWGLWKPTALWLVLGGIGLLFRFNEVLEQPGFGWRVGVRTIALVEIVSFLADLASFHLWLEIPAQGFAFIAGVIVAWAASTERPVRGSMWASLYLVLYSLVAVGWAIGRVVSNWEAFDHSLHLREFFVPIWLTPVALAGVYAFAIFCAYQTTFVEMTLVNHEGNLFRQRLALVLRTAGRVGRLRVLRRVKGTHFMHTSGFRDAWTEFGEILRQGPV